MSFKSFDLAHDVASIISPINEVISITASLYGPVVGDQNVKKYNNIASGSSVSPYGGYWETVFDSSPTSIQSTALFDITFGAATNLTATTYLRDEKIKMYRQMASVLWGNQDAVFTINSGSTTECFFVMIKRGIMKDELKKGTTVVTLSGSSGVVTIQDTNAASAFKQTVGGDYAPLYLSGTSTEVGQVWYNAGVIVIPASSSGIPWSKTVDTWSGSLGDKLDSMITGSTIDQLSDGFRGHMSNLAFHNQTNLYSTVYFCRATNTDFNYSSNPTYVDQNQRIRVTSGSNVLQSRTYITKIGLYDANDNLLAVGSVNKPITKSPDTESIFRVRLDY